MEFWEQKFSESNIPWGTEPCDSAFRALEYFTKKQIKHVLIPGFGYGRNASLFIENGINITGIEISKSAIFTAKEKLKIKAEVFHGSVLDMPFDKTKYDGIFCYALLHLFNKTERKALIEKCYNQLLPGGTMFFIVISKESELFAQGRIISSNRYEVRKGLKVYFYDIETALKEFSNCGKVLADYFFEPIKFNPSEKPVKMVFVTCHKPK